MSSPRGLVRPDSGLFLYEHFYTNDNVTDDHIGELGWQVTNIGNASTLVYKTAEPYGVLRATTAATADGDGSALHLFPDGLVLQPDFEFGARVRRPVELASLNFRIGLDDSVTATRPTVGVTVESDAGVLSCHADSADHGDNSELVSNAGTGLTAGTTEVVGEWLEILVKASGRANANGGPDAVDFWLNDVHVAHVICNIDNDEEVEPKIAFWQNAGAADAVIIDFDYYWFFQPYVD